MKTTLKGLGLFIASTAILFLFLYGLLAYSNHVYLERYKAGNDDYYLQAQHYEEVTGDKIIQDDELYQN
ncbi:hypothetical protein ACWOE5_09460 [Aerococcus sanguinicola]|uniref:Uncharacterized protein n=1 Tax=Aerococcus sanguinicola TaxID=119206 RepID=A0A0X8FBW2_9LACT|nr:MULTISPECIES: hypothetical protein [Aerococcus]AMB94410.1 hypothetical protein AWM72_06360 [Aerococcus sanguinicola]MDK7051096.1 hypothetical protein [Aerococcus sanguinicola]OFT94080.1 hypothetical protein HMPREF3090_06060 [Aerococcus sp. HMSC23C02]PKZ20733.1 hypothetical protein CYJ28_09625 [Aerococcus sanguinicola]